MLTLRLSRMGKKKQPTYRLIVSEKGRDPWGRALELLGTYNPRTKVALFKTDRITYWMSKGAQSSPTVWNLLVREKIVTGTVKNVVAKTKSNPPKKETPAEAKVEEKKEQTPAAEAKQEPPAEQPAA